MDDLLDIGEILYQKFLLDIYRHCDKMGLVNIPSEEKEEMAADMVDFVANVIKSLESRKPLIKLEKRDVRKLKILSRIVSDRVRQDEFSKSVINYYVSSKKLRQKEIDSYLTIAAIVILSKGRKTDIRSLEKKIKQAKPYLFRVASLLSPAALLHEKLFLRT